MSGSANNEGNIAGGKTSASLNENDVVYAIESYM